jgi:hypothetical protein
MKKYRLPFLVLPILALAWWSYAGGGGLPVWDAAADLQAKWNALQRAAAEVRAYGQMIRQYEQDARGIYNTGEAVLQGAKQLASMPTNLSVFGLLAHYDSAVTRLTGMVDTGTRTMGALYDQVGTVATAAGREKLLGEMQAERLRLIQILVSAQTDQQWVADAQKRMRELVQAANNAEGQKAVAQAVANATAMQAAHNQQVQAWNEALGKVELLEKLEQQAFQAAQALKAQEEAVSWYAHQPAPLPPGFNGFRILPGGQ